MTTLMKQALAHWPHGEMSALALLIFLAVFIGAFLRAYSGKNREELERIARLPLEDSEFANLKRGSHV